MTDEIELTEEGRQDIYVTRRGVAVRLRLFSPVLRDRVRQSVDFPEPPVYIAKTAGGGEEEHPYTEDMIETDEERAIWREYQAGRMGADLLLYERLGRLALLRGTDVEIPDDGWEAEQALFGVAVPDDPLERKLHWLETEAVDSNSDLRDLILAVLQYQQVGEEARALAAATFRGGVEGNSAGETEGTQGGLAGE